MENFQTQALLQSLCQGWWRLSTLTYSRSRTPHTEHIAERITYQHRYSYGFGVIISTGEEDEQEKRVNHNKGDANPLVKARIFRLAQML